MMGTGSARPVRWLTLATHVSADGRGGGMIRYTVEFIQALRRRDDVDLTVLAHPRAADFFADLLGGRDRVRLAPAASVPVVSAVERYGLGRLVRRFDVVHGTKHLLPLRQPGHRARLVLTAHDMLPLDRPKDFGVSKRWFIREPYLGSIRSADRVVCVSGATRDRLVSYVPSARTRTSVVPLAADGGLLRSASAPVPGLAGRSFALVVGDDSPRKNLGLLLDAMAMVAERLPGAVLAVAGPPNWGVSADADLMRRLVEAGVVLQLGFVSDEQLRWCYENAGVVCCPSALEGFGLPALEAHQLGAPLVTSDDPALVEVSGPDVLHLSSWDARAWVEPLVLRLGEPRRPAAVRPGVPLGRTWDDVVTETKEAVGV